MSDLLAMIACLGHCIAFPVPTRHASTNHRDLDSRTPESCKIMQGSDARRGSCPEERAARSLTCVITVGYQKQCTPSPELKQLNTDTSTWTPRSKPRLSCGTKYETQEPTSNVPLRASVVQSLVFRTQVAASLKCSDRLSLPALIHEHLHHEIIGWTYVARPLCSNTGS